MLRFSHFRPCKYMNNIASHGIIRKISMYLPSFLQDEVKRFCQIHLGPFPLSIRTQVQFPVVTFNCWRAPIAIMVSAK